MVVGLGIAILLQWVSYRGQWVVGPDGKLGGIDFCWFWVSGKFAAMRDPSRIYDPALYAAAQNVYYPPGQCLWLLHQYVYPPTFLFFTYWLGVMPYLLAFAVWIGTTLLLYLAAVYAILPRPAALIAAIASPAALKNFQLGHNGFLTAGLIATSLVLLERRPWLSGVVLGVFTYKPQFGVLFPLALLVSRNWRALAGAIASGLIISIAAALVFGFRTWPAFIGSLLNRSPGLSPQAGVELRLDPFMAFCIGRAPARGLPGRSTSWLPSARRRRFAPPGRSRCRTRSKPRRCALPRFSSALTCWPTISASSRSLSPFWSRTGWCAAFAPASARSC